MDQEIVMSTGILQVYAIKKKTQAKLFKNLRTGSKIRLSIPIVSVGQTSGGCRAAYIDIENLDTGEKTSQTFNILPNILRCFDFINVQE